MVVIVMGVAGSGKTTVGQALAGDLGWIFADADDFHSAASRAKMAANHPLDDADRAPWLARLRTQIEAWTKQGANAVLACSALKESYRVTLTADLEEVRTVYLYGDKELILSRLNRRSNHYMPPTLLDSQLATLEPPRDALALDVAATPSELVSRIRREFGI